MQSNLATSEHLATAFLAVMGARKMDDKLWQMFTDAWLTAMLDFQSEKISIEQAWDMIGEFSEEDDDEIEQFACNTISEISGFPIGYRETIDLLKRNPSKQEVLAYMHS